ncbi:hypothetical protein [Pseudactinotalea sp. HY158]|uniref:hypothetical protein n=1 Tax=Pseudactinotalea sp. HY158 TaxID=2654547 RepID=UPI00129C2A4A|nr:hypothetical protein [Pseudactinotalea sp. HY158]QGH68948.1 hypothetical protein GCE65_05095 [Pseudactinotalea sp. HY158]
MWKFSLIRACVVALAFLGMSTAAQAVPSPELVLGSDASAEGHEVAPYGLVNMGDWFKSKASCEARGRYLQRNPPPLVHYDWFICVQNPDGRWSLLMNNPNIGCFVVAPVEGSLTTGRIVAPAAPLDC